MAIVFQNNVVSSGTAAAAGALMQTAMRDALTAHPSGAWTVADEFDSAGATVHWVVMKNATLISGVGVDFFVVIGRLASSGAICVMVCEEYNTTTKVMSIYAPQSNNNTTLNYIIANGAYSSNFNGGNQVKATYTLSTTIAPGTINPLAPQAGALATGRLVSMVDQDYTVMSVNGTVLYFGALTDLIVPSAGLVAATPIGIANLFDVAAATFGALTRQPIAAEDAALATLWPHLLVPINDPNRLALCMMQYQAFATALYGYQDRYQGPRMAATEMAAIMYSAAGFGSVSAGSTAAKTGALRGKFKNLRVATYPTAVANLDTITVDGRKHIVLGDKGLMNVSAVPGFFTPNGHATAVKHGFVFDTGVAA